MIIGLSMIEWLENNMKCPKCKKEIVNVNVISECWQKAEVNKNGEIIDWGSVEDILDTIKIEHRDNDCLADLKGIVTE